MKVIYLITFVLLTQSLFAQTNPLGMVTDRPDITESAVTVPLHFIQIETGYQFNANEFNYTYHYGSTLLRYGLTPNIELRFAGEYQSLKIKPSVEIFPVENNLNYSYERQTKGFAGTMIGAKFQVINENYSSYNLAVLTQLYLPWGKSGLVPDKMEPEIMLALDKNVADRLNLAINAGIHLNSSTKTVDIFYSLSTGVALSKILSFYGEYSGIYHNPASGSYLSHVVDTGLMILLHNNIQIDIYTGTNVITNTVNWFWGSGISVRFPK